MKQSPEEKLLEAFKKAHPGVISQYAFAGSPPEEPKKKQPLKRISFLFAWYDLWIGLFWDKKKKWLYILPMPMCGIIIRFK